MRGSNGQKFNPDTGRSGPADCGVVDEDWFGLTGDVQVDGELHAGKWADDALHAASLGRKVSD